ncbi:MAG: glycosyltransferase family 39 protein [Eubacteriales bacterium]|nr:glycosyltransferase family 39 protein [Eubacteriales bacterium]
MEEIMEQEKNNKSKVGLYICLAVMIAIQLGVIIYCFQFKKEGYHSDEMWSYGYANSYNLKDVYQDADGNPLNVGMWTSSDVLKDYIAVNEGEEFEYGSIYRNQIYDLSPPFHSIVLHTICSFFPETFSPWYSFSINIVSFIVCMIFLFKVCCLLMDEKQGLLVCLVYGFCRAAIDNFCYLRMYAMCTAFVMVMLYGMLKVVKMKKQESYWKMGILLFVVSVLAFLTHYYMVAIGGIMTALFCCYLLCTKQIKRMFQLGFTMLGALIASIAIFPSLLVRSQSQADKIAGDNAEMYNYTFEIRQRILWNFITSKTCGIQISIFRSAWPQIILGCLIYVLILMIPVVFLLRKTKLIQNIKNKLIYCVKNFGSVTKKGIQWILKKINWCYVIIFVTCALQLIVVSETSSVYGMGNYEDRYIFYLSPLFLIVYIGLIAKILKIVFGRIPKIKNKSKLVTNLSVGLFCLFLIVINLRVGLNSSFYYFSNEKEGYGLEDIVDGQNIVYIEKSSWMLTAMCAWLGNFDEFLLIDDGNYKKFNESYYEKMQDKKLYLMVNENDYQNDLLEFSQYTDVDMSDDSELDGLDEEYYELVDYFDTLYSDAEIKLIGKETIMRRKMAIYLVNPTE